jgi:hypothetical protein
MGFGAVADALQDQQKPLSYDVRTVCMALPWLTILKTVPWRDVIQNAPKVVDGAKKLWNTAAARKDAARPATPGAPDAGMEAPSSAVGGEDAMALAVARLQARIATQEATTAELREQMLASSEVIKALADQNAQLIKGIDLNRARTAWLGVACAILTLVAVAALVIAVKAAA